MSERDQVCVRTGPTPQRESVALWEDVLCVTVCVRVCVLSPSVRPWLGRRREGDFKTGRGKEQRQLGMSEPLSCEERGGFCAVRTLSERCQNTVRTLSERCQNAVRTLLWVGYCQNVASTRKRAKCEHLQDRLKSSQLEAVAPVRQVQAEVVTRCCCCFAVKGCFVCQGVTH